MKLKRNRTISEDWLATLLGLYLIFMFVSGVSIPAPAYSWKNLDDLSAKVLTLSNVFSIVKQFALVFLVSGVAAYIAGKRISTLAKALFAVFMVAQLALVLAGNSVLKSYNLEAVVISLVVGLGIGHLVKIPEEWRGVISSEWFIKVGLVLLGTSVIFSDILSAGWRGMAQAVVVVLSVWYLSYWICRKFKIDDELTFMLSSAVSICGVSAAIATAGVIKGDNKKLSYVISIVLLLAIPMLIGMPVLAKLLGLSAEATGAWLGGTIDTTGAVVAAGTLAGDTALKVSTIVKFSQNVLLGVAAFLISLYWTIHTEKTETTQPRLALVWERFPKFVFGFVLASLFFSFALDQQHIASIKDGLKSMQSLWFGLAFVAIGAEARLGDLFNQSNQKPLYAFVLAQLANILITLIVAVLLFS